MVWRISKEITKKQVSDTQKTALYGLILIVPLALLAWGIEHLQYIGQNMAKTFKDFAEACWDTHKQVGFKMKGGKRVPNCVPKNEDNLEETSDKAMMLKLMTKAMKTMPNSQAQKEIIKQVNVYRKKLGLFALKEEGKDIPLSLYDLSELGPAAMKRRARMRARMGMLQKKYGDASKAGIHPSRVSQRHNKMTVKKGK